MSDDIFARVRRFAMNRALANDRDPQLAADIAELEFARGASINDAVAAGAGPFEPARKRLSTQETNKMIERLGR